MEEERVIEGEVQEVFKDVVLDVVPGNGAERLSKEGNGVDFTKFLEVG